MFKLVRQILGAARFPQRAKAPLIPHPEPYPMPLPQPPLWPSQTSVPIPARPFD